MQARVNRTPGGVRIGSAGAAALAPRALGRRRAHAPLRNSSHVAAAAAGDGSAAAEFPPGWGPQKGPTILERIKRFFIGDKLDKERLKALGMGAFASYGFISNVNYGFALGMAWLAFVKRYGVSPMAEGQWPPFLAFYAGFWALQNFARPLRLSLAIALAPAFDRAITAIGEKLNISKGFAFGIYIFGLAVFTSSALFGTLYLLGGFP